MTAGDLTQAGSWPMTADVRRKIHDVSSQPSYYIHTYTNKRTVPMYTTYVIQYSRAVNFFAQENWKIGNWKIGNPIEDQSSNDRTHIYGRTPASRVGPLHNEQTINRLQPEMSMVNRIHRMSTLRCSRKLSCM